MRRRRRCVADDLTVSVVTLGPGDHPFFKFGHDAIWIHDASDGSDRVYNFGTFTFDSPRLIIDFLHGRMTYWLSVSGIGATVAAYEHENRSIDVQELALDPAAKRALKERLDINAQPQNRAYKYDYFADNCATRVRDVVDWAAGGRLHAAGRAPARLSLRDQALRMTVSYLPLYLGIDPGAGARGRPADRSLGRDVHSRGAGAPAWPRRRCRARLAQRCRWLRARRRSSRRTGRRRRASRRRYEARSWASACWSGRCSGCWAARRRRTGWPTVCGLRRAS